MLFYTVEQIGPKRGLTPDGFLLCEDVPIARTGIQVYGPGETSITTGGDGRVYIDRSEAEVFRLETIASFNGKPVLNDHPRDGAPVDPDTWRELAVGVVMNPRRGTGTEENYLIADLLITERSAIDDVMDGKRQVSCGYGADWIETSVGHGEQRNIIGNHVALVSRARCGSRCSIGDNANEKQHQEEPRMWDKIKKALMAHYKVANDAALDDAMKSKEVVVAFGADGEVHLHEAPERTKFTDEELEKRFAANDARHRGHDEAFEEVRQHTGMSTHAAADGEEEERRKAEDAARRARDNKEIEGELREEAPPGTGDAAVRAQDSAYLEDSFADTLSAAEILVPGIQAPVFDKAHAPKQTFLDMCNFRRRALIQASKDAKTAELIKEYNRGRIIGDGAIQALKCGQVRDMFFAVSALKKRSNNESARTVSLTAAGPAGSTGKYKTVADINKANRAKFGGN